MKRDLIGEFRDVASLSEWLKSRKDAVGMKIDLEAAILTVLRINDSQFSVRYDDDGDIVATIDYPFQARDLDDFEPNLYRIWSRVGLGYSLIHREYQVDAVVYRFITGTKKFGYQGMIILRGEHIQHFLSELKRRQHASADSSP